MNVKISKVKGINFVKVFVLALLLFYPKTHEFDYFLCTSIPLHYFKRFQKPFSQLVYTYSAPNDA